MGVWAAFKYRYLAYRNLVISLGMEVLLEATPPPERCNKIILSVDPPIRSIVDTPIPEGAGRMVDSIS